MAFRSDLQGGMSGLGIIGGQAAAGIEKNMKWKVLFFSGALVTFLPAVVTIYHSVKQMHRITKFAWEPFPLIASCFLLYYSLLMMLLDFPLPKPPEALVDVRDHVYKRMLFLTRFMGRGIWYIFLATEVFMSLWRPNINWIMGGVCCTYLLVLGAATLIKGSLISYRLQMVREAILCSGRESDHYIAPNQKALSKEHFKSMVLSVTAQDHVFSNDEVDYVLNALSFTSENDGQVTREEFAYWLLPGPPLMV